MPLSLSRYTPELEKIHHPIVVEFGRMNELVGDIVNHANILEYAIQFFTRYPLTPLTHGHQHFCKVKAYRLWNMCNGHKVCFLLLKDYDIDAFVYRLWDGCCTHHIISIHMLSTLPFIHVLWQWSRHIILNCLWELGVGVKIWACINTKMWARVGEGLAPFLNNNVVTWTHFVVVKT